MSNNNSTNNDKSNDRNNVIVNNFENKDSNEMELWQEETPLHCTILQYTTLYCTALGTTLHCTTLQHTTRHRIKLDHRNAIGAKFRQVSE